MELQEEQLPCPPSPGTVLFPHSKKNTLGQVSVDNIFTYLHRVTASEFSCLFLLSCLTVSEIHNEL